MHGYILEDRIELVSSHSFLKRLGWYMARFMHMGLGQHAGSHSQTDPMYQIHAGSSPQADPTPLALPAEQENLSATGLEDRVDVYL